MTLRMYLPKVLYSHCTPYLVELVYGCGASRREHTELLVMLCSSQPRKLSSDVFNASGVNKTSNVYLIDRNLIQQTNMMELLYYYLYLLCPLYERVRFARLYLLAL